MVYHDRTENRERRKRICSPTTLITLPAHAASAGIIVVLGNPVSTDPAKVANIDGTLGENNRYGEDANDGSHAYGYPYPTAYRH